MSMAPDMPAASRKRRRVIKAAVCVASLVLTTAGVETYYRITEVGTGGTPKPYDGWPLRDQWLADKAAMPQTPRYYDYHCWSAPPYKSQTLNFEFYHGYPCVQRRVPDSTGLETCDTVVWLFGGSTMQNTETSDEGAIANHVARALTAAGHRPTVVNFGAGGFTSSLEFIRLWDLLRRSSGRQIPDYVVFYDGYNDALFGGAHGAGVMGEDYHSRLAALVERQHGRLFWYTASEALGRWSAAWRRLVLTSVRTAFYQRYAASAASWASDRAVECAGMYVKNIRSIQAICGQESWGRRITPVFILQPLVFLKTPNTAWEQEIISTLGEGQPRFTRQFYEEARSRLRSERTFFDLSGCLDGRAEDDFIDFGHIAPETGQVIGRRIADVLEGLIREQRQSRDAESE
jgi:hypothetical protein